MKKNDVLQFMRNNVFFSCNRLLVISCFIKSLVGICRSIFPLKAFISVANNINQCNWWSTGAGDYRTQTEQLVWQTAGGKQRLH